MSIERHVITRRRLSLALAFFVAGVPSLTVGCGGDPSPLEEEAEADADSDPVCPLDAIDVPVATLEDGDVLACGGSRASQDEGGAAIPSADCWRIQAAPVACWSAASMATPRAGDPLLRLADGRVLAFGGTQDGFAELYDPDDDAWTPIPGLFNRALGGAVQLSDGRVIVAGGFPNDLMTTEDEVTAIDALDPSELSVGRLGGLLSAQWGHRLVAIDDDTVLSVGGQNGVVPVGNQRITIEGDGATVEVSHALPAGYVDWGGGSVAMRAGGPLYSLGDGAPGVETPVAPFVYDDDEGFSFGPPFLTPRLAELVPLSSGTVAAVTRLVEGGLSVELLKPGAEAFVPGPTLDEPLLVRSIAPLPGDRLLLLGAFHLETEEMEPPRVVPLLAE